jgi:glyoxylase-like metal-dependent hydrolase (beta-lactamase superfamily II)
VDKVLENPFPNIEILTADGHTEKMLMPKISYQNKEILFIADTMPSHAHVAVPYVMGYDIRPLQTMIEKQDLLLQATDNEWIIFFDHDPMYDCATIGKTEKGFVIKEKGIFGEFV